MILGADELKKMMSDSDVEDASLAESFSELKRMLDIMIESGWTEDQAIKLMAEISAAQWGKQT